MGKHVEKLEADVVIAGGGPGGCTIAKELSRKGKKVALLEKGGNGNWFIGNPLGVITRLEKECHFPLPVKSTTEGDNVREPPEVFPKAAAEARPLASPGLVVGRVMEGLKMLHFRHATMPALA